MLNTMVHVETKRRKRVRSRTVTERKLWCELKRATSHAEIASYMHGKRGWISVRGKLKAYEYSAPR